MAKDSASSADTLLVDLTSTRPIGASKGSASAGDSSPHGARPGDNVDNPAPSGSMEEQYRLGLEAAPIGILIVDARGEICLVNRQIETLFGYARQELLGQRVEFLMPERFRSKHPEMMHAFLKQPVARYMGQGRDLFGRRKDGSEFAIEIGLNPSHSGNERLVLASIVDVTARKIQEAEIQQRVQELQRYQVEMSLLSQMSSLLQHAVNHREAYGIVAAFGEQLLPHGSGISGVGVYVSRSSGNALECQASWGTAPSGRFAPDSCWGLRRSQSHYVGPADDGSPFLPSCSHGRSDDGWSLCVPMAASGQSVGLIALSGAEALPDSVRVGYERIARAVADQLALAINNLNLRQSLEQLSIRDPLTGLYNRRHMEEAAVREYARAKRSNSRLSILMVDVDHFKQFNDTHGHQAADEALAGLGRDMLAHFRESDVVCRYGGEEFLVVLPDCDKATAVELANKLCKRVREADLRITVSVGVAEFPSDGHSWDMLVRKADAALYQAKADGRDCVRSADTDK